MLDVEPKVFVVAETKIDEVGLSNYLKWVGAPRWESTACSEAEELVEVMGRLCYRSFEPGLNKNVKKVRESSVDYMANILFVKHGSVLEHAMVSFVFADVSRVFTHELVRHRQGVAISQESLRFVRLDKLKAWMPTVIREDLVGMTMFRQTFEHLEKLQQELAQHFQLDDPGIPFSKKKIITSALRRIAPIGLATSIGWTANMRTIRWVLEMRTAPSAEEEIRLVFGKVGEIMLERYPTIFQDFEVESVNGLPCYKPANSKV